MVSPPSVTTALKRTLRPLHLWAIAVGLVISGDYFGWNYGLASGGAVGLLVSTGVVTVLYVTFIFSYTELATAIPQAGGPFAFAHRALGPFGGFLAGVVTLVEFVFAPPAIARAIGAYVHFRAPSLGVTAVALGAFVVFAALNAWGVALAAQFELVVTGLATFELLLFFGLTGPHVSWARIATPPLFPGGWLGVLATVPSAIWFYLGIEGVAMSAEETVDPKRDVPRGYLAGIATLVVLSVGTLLCSVGILPTSELVKDDSPLPKVLAAVLAHDHPMTHLMVYLGLFGLLASFHAIVLGASRQVFALARAGFLPRALAWVHPTRQTPIWALVAVSVVGAMAVLSERTDALIALSCLGAVGLYGMSLASLFVLRRREPQLERPFRTPGYPWVPAVAAVLTTLALGVLAYVNPTVFAVFLALLALSAVAYRATLLRTAKALTRASDK